MVMVSSTRKAKPCLSQEHGEGASSTQGPQAFLPALGKGWSEGAQCIYQPSQAESSRFESSGLANLSILV